MSEMRDLHIRDIKIFGPKLIGVTTMGETQPMYLETALADTLIEVDWQRDSDGISLKGTANLSANEHEELAELVNKLRAYCHAVVEGELL